MENYRYSGKHSKKFWDRVRATGNNTLYIMGCALQEMGVRMFQALREAEGHENPDPLGK